MRLKVDPWPPRGVLAGPEKRGGGEAWRGMPGGNVVMLSLCYSARLFLLNISNKMYTDTSQARIVLLVFVSCFTYDNFYLLIFWGK